MQKYVIALYIRLSLEDYKYDSMLPREAQCLTLTQAQKQAAHERRIILASLCRIHKSGNLLHG